MTPALWIQLIVALISAASQLAKNTGTDPLPKDITEAKARLHAVVEALES